MQVLWNEFADERENLQLVGIIERFAKPCEGSLPNVQERVALSELSLKKRKDGFRSWNTTSLAAACAGGFATSSDFSSRCAEAATVLSFAAIVRIRHFKLVC